MISIDQYVLDAVSNNWLTISIFMAALKCLAKVTPGTADDRVYTLLSNIFNALKPGNKNGIRIKE
jgi:hypothetical protein